MALTVHEYAFWPDPENAEIGLLFCEDDDGQHWTLSGDPDLVRMLRDAPPETRDGVEIGGGWRGGPTNGVPRRMETDALRTSKCGSPAVHHLSIQAHRDTSDPHT